MQKESLSSDFFDNDQIKNLIKLSESVFEAARNQSDKIAQDHLISAADTILDSIYRLQSKNGNSEYVLR